MAVGQLMKNNEQPKQIFLEDYSEPSFWIRKTQLSFDIFEEETIVEAELNIEKNVNVKSNELQLNGQDLELLSVSIDGRLLSDSEYRLDDESLTLVDLQESHVLSIRTKRKGLERLHTI